MNKLEVFFDYSCPFCMLGHQYLKDILKKFKNLEIVWRPCEAHPRPEKFGPHSDLCIRGFYYAVSEGVDIWAYHDAMYKAAVTDKSDIENINVLSAYVRGLIEPEDFRRTIKSGEYKKELDDANDYAYNRSGVWVIPAYRLNSERLDSKEGIGVTKDQLFDFVEHAVVYKL